MVHGDKVGRDQYKADGNARLTVTHQGGLSHADLEAAIAELRSFVTDLTREGLVDADGAVVDPGGVVAAVRSRRGRLRALARAVSGGAGDAVLSAVQGGVAALVTGLVQPG
ncbi:hypothetical protein AB0K09_29780 [Streptomyces sp. NPDC049577]|uniref:hypothetical protein n=1 Tax=Streptomyces sp. NPDC049577 TaxID=3155153 RepID=UPI00343749F2